MTGLGQTIAVPEQPTPAAAQTAQITAAPAQTTAAVKGGFKVEETRLGQFDWSEYSRPIISADGRHVAYLASGNACPKGTKSCVILDGKVIPVSNDLTLLGGLALNFDGTRFAYPAFRDKKPLLVMDGQSGPEYDNRGLSIGGPKDLIFSPDGKRLAYVAAEGSLRYLSFRQVVDGKAGAEYDEILNLVFSPDSRRVAFAARTGKKWTVVVDGFLGAGYDEIFGPTFSPDSKRVVFGALQGKTWSVIMDGQAGAAYDELLLQVADGLGTARGVGISTMHYRDAIRLVFSPDSKHLAYAAKRSGKWVIVEDGREGAEFQGIGIGSPAFSPNGKRVAYSVQEGGSWSVTVDGQTGPGFGQIFNPSFSPDGKHVAYVACKRGLGRDCALVVDGQPGAEQWAIGNWTFSPDGKHLAYTAQMSEGLNLYGDPYKGGKWSMVLDGQAGAEYSVILPKTVFFDSDGALEFLAAQKENHSIVENHGSLYRVKYIPTP